jgi:hypothetical protein
VGDRTHVTQRYHALDTFQGDVVVAGSEYVDGVPKELTLGEHVQGACNGRLVQRVAEIWRPTTFALNPWLGTDEDEWVVLSVFVRLYVLAAARQLSAPQ